MKIFETFIYDLPINSVIKRLLQEGDLMKEEMKTGTTTLGIKCKDGIVLATDRKVTSGFFIAGSYEKVVKITDDIAVTTAGTVSDIQLLTHLITAELKLRTLRTGKINTVKEAVN